MSSSPSFPSKKAFTRCLHSRCCRRIRTSTDYAILPPRNSSFLLVKPSSSGSRTPSWPKMVTSLLFFSLPCPLGLQVWPHPCKSKMILDSPPASCARGHLDGGRPCQEGRLQQDGRCGGWARQPCIARRGERVGGERVLP